MKNVVIIIIKTNFFPSLKPPEAVLGSGVPHRCPGGRRCGTRSGSCDSTWLPEAVPTAEQ